MTEISNSPDVRRAHRSELNPLSFLQRSEFVYPEKVAVVHDDRRYTYREFGERVRRLGSALRDAGLQKGDRVAFIAPNIPALLEAHYGVPAAGGVLVAINYRLNAKDVGYILEHSGARFVFVDHEFEELARDYVAHRTIRIDDTGGPGDPYEAFLAEGSPDPLPDVLEDEDEPISINYTSGTTGRPKGAVYHHRGAYLNALGEVIETGAHPGKRLPVDAPDVPLQRLVLPLGSHSRGRPPHLSAEGRAGAHLGSHRRRRRDALQRRANRADLIARPRAGAHPRPRSHHHGFRLPALSPAVRPADGLGHPTGPRLRRHRAVRAVHDLRTPAGVEPADARRSRPTARSPGRPLPGRGAGSCGGRQGR